jgi:hypothetical protein
VEDMEKPPFLSARDTATFICSGDAPWYVSNATLQANLGISYVQDVIHQKCNNHHTRLEPHENPFLKKLLLREENRRLKRNWPIDLI